jgi:heptosyltransferase-2
VADVTTVPDEPRDGLLEAPREARRTLVVAPNWVGDCVMAEPLFRALAASGRELVTLARPSLAPLLALFPGVVEQATKHADRRATVGAIQAAACDEAVVVPNSFSAAWLVARAGVPRRYGYRGDLRGPLLDPAVSRPRGRGTQIEEPRALVAAMGVAPPDSWVPRLTLPAELARRGVERLRRARIEGDAPLVGLFPGAEWGASKRWPWRRFADLATELRRRRPDARLAIFVGPKETWLGVRVFEESGKIHPVLGPDLDLAGLAAVLARLDLLVTNDSGPMHLAAALGVDTVALFGPTDPRRTAPAGDGHTVLYRDLWCSPCFRRRCPLLHHGCLAGIGVAQVADAAVERLAARRPPAG